MKALQIVTVLLFFLVARATAQQETMKSKTAEQRTEMITKNLSEKLALSQSQTDSVSDVILKREKLRDAGKLTDEKKKQTDAEIKSILTKEQQVQWKELRKEAREKHDQKKGKSQKGEKHSE